MRKLLGILCVVFCLTGCAGLKEVYLYNTLSTEEWNDRQREKALLADFNSACTIYQADKPVNTSLVYTQFLTDLSAKLKEEGNEIIGAANQNMVLHRVAYEALNQRIYQLKTLLPRYQKFYEQSCYQNLKNQLQTMISMQNTVCQNAWNYEKQQFVSKTGAELLPEEDTVVSVSNPKKGIMYSLEDAQVFQNTKGGILVRGNNGKIRFVATANIYADDEYLNGFAVYTGITSYITTLKTNKTVYAFKELPASKYKSIYDKLLFYPTSNAGTCSSSRNVAYDEIRQAFKTTAPSFVENWGEEKISPDTKSARTYYSPRDFASIRERSLADWYGGVAEATSEKPAAKKGVLENINTFFLQKE